ncbi:MAG: HlyD family efflux transporter periplasmic adaptor subunit [Bacteroidales bacterium]|nr:HlyD family efflux transporter periplasmic adaptor subunit [Bacteroidales bacterium]
MRKKIYIGLGLMVVIIISLWYFLGAEDSEIHKVTVFPKEGRFQINVVTTGELEAKSSEKIYGPSGLRSVRIWNVKIEDIVSDGTVVDSGQYIATLDRTEISNRIKDVESEVEKLESQYIKTKLDTTMDMRNARNQLINLEYNLEEKRIKLEQSKYEPPATIRQYQIDLEKGERDLTEALNNYDLNLEKAAVLMQEVSVTLEQERRNLDQMLSVRDQFIVKAPKAGMVIYKRSWDGAKQGVGSTVSAWDNVVATLPDLSKMISKTYVNEIDISKIKTGQQVEIGVDAFPEKSYTGEVIEVANIGEQMKNSNAKVFEILIEIYEFDSILRPSMTTKNTIITAVIDSVRYIPFEAVNNNDSLTFVYTTAKKRQQIILGKSNENEVIVRAGLKPGEEIYLLPPVNPDNFRIVTLDSAIIHKLEEKNQLKKKQNTTLKKDNKQLHDKKLTPEQIKKLRAQKGGSRQGGKNK